MQITDNLTFRDFVDAQTLHAKRSELANLGHRASHYFYPAIGLFILAFEFTPHPIFKSHESTAFGVISAAALLSLPIYLHFASKRSNSRLRTGSGECMIDFGEDRIQTKSLHSRSEVEWNAIRSISEDKKGFLLYLAPARFLALPKRVFSNEEIEELRSILARKINPQSFPIEE